MNWSIYIAMINSIAILLVLSAVNEHIYMLPKKYGKNRLIYQGLLASVICLVLMIVPKLIEGSMLIDARTILISVTALSFGFIPAIITVVVSSIFTFVLNGQFSLLEILQIFFSAFIGLCIRYGYEPKSKALKYLTVYLMGLAVHIVYILSLFMQTGQSSAEFVSSVSIPLLVLYPLASVLLAVFITQQVNSQKNREELKRSQEKFQMLFDNAPLGYISLDETGKIVDINKQLINMLGFNNEEIVGKNFTDILNPKNIAKVRNEFEKLIKTGILHTELEFTLINGHNIMVSAEGKVSRSSNGDIVQAQCIIQDITEQKRALELLRESERSKTLLLSNLYGIAYRVEYEDKWIMKFMSAGCLEITGYPPEHFVNNRDMTFNSLILPEYSDAVDKEWERIIAEHTTFRYEYPIMDSSGRKRWLYEVAKGIYEPNGSCRTVEGVIIDITLQKDREEQIKYINNHDYLTGVYNRQYATKASQEFDKKSIFLSQ